MEEERRKIEGREERERNRRGGKVGVYKGRMEKEGKWREQPHKTNNKQRSNFCPNNANLDKVTTTKSLNNLSEFLISDLNIRSLEITMSILKISKG